MGRIDTVVEVTFPADPSLTSTITTARLSINTFSWLEIKKSGQSSPQILSRLHRALLKVNPALPNSIVWTDITVSLPASKPVS